MTNPAAPVTAEHREKAHELIGDLAGPCYPSHGNGGQWMCDSVSAYIAAQEAELARRDQAFAALDGEYGACRADLDRNAADVMRLQGLLAEARGALRDGQRIVQGLWSRSPHSVACECKMCLDVSAFLASLPGRPTLFPPGERR